MKYLRVSLNKKWGKSIGEEALRRYKEYCNVEAEDLAIPVLEDRYTGAVEDWKSFQAEEFKSNQDNLFELYLNEIGEDTEQAQKLRKKALRTIK